MFERFTDKARRIVVASQQEARRLRHNYIGTEHLLLAFTSEAGSPTARVLAGLGCTRDKLLELVDGTIGSGADDASGHIPFTAAAKRVLELSLAESVNTGSESIRSEHLLMALVRSDRGSAVDILAAVGVDTDELLRRLTQSVADADEPGGGPGPDGQPSFADRLTAIETALARISDRLDALERRQTG